MSRPTSPFVHGTTSGYITHRCRCDECRAAVRAYHRDWRARNPDKIREYNRQHSDRRNPEKTREYSRNYYANHREAVLQAGRDYRARLRRDAAAWRAEHPEATG